MLKADEGLPFRYNCPQEAGVIIGSFLAAGYASSHTYLIKYIHGHEFAGIFNVAIWHIMRIFLTMYFIIELQPFRSLQ
jgi:hypothetical protein